MPQYTIVNTLEVKNICEQVVVINIQEKKFSPIYKKSGATPLAPGVTVIAEDSRFDRKQLQSIQNKKMIKVTPGKQTLVIPTPGGGSSGSGSV